MKKFVFIFVLLLLAITVINAQESISKPMQIKTTAKEELFNDVSGKELEISDMVSIDGAHYLRSGFVGRSNYINLHVYGLNAYRLNQLRMKKIEKIAFRKTREGADIVSDYVPGVKTVKKAITTGKKIYNFLFTGWE